MRSVMLLGVLASAGAAHAQSTIYGMDVRQNWFYTSDTGDFVNNMTQIGPNTDALYAIDFDASATTLWGINNDTYEYGTFDLSTGVFSPLGGTAFATGTVTGLTAAADGVTWYVSHYDSAAMRSFLYEGDVTTGTFTQVGFIHPGIIIDIAIDVTGAMYGHSITTDSLYSVNTTTGASTLIGPTGQVAAFAQGMDFDWSNGVLYAAVYTSGGTGIFAEMNLTTGTAMMLEDTTPTDGEFEVAIEVPGPSTGFGFCFGDGSGGACPCGNTGGPGEGCANSTGAGAVLEGSGGTSVSGDTLAFACSNLLPGQPALLFVGLNQINNGDGAVFGDGLRCAGSGVVRLGVDVPDAGGNAGWGPGLGAQGGWASGDVRRFQVWYRNPMGSPCGAAFNLSHGFEVTFSP